MNSSNGNQDPLFIHGTNPIIFDPYGPPTQSTSDSVATTTKKDGNVPISNFSEGTIPAQRIPEVGNPFPSFPALTPNSMLALNQHQPAPSVDLDEVKQVGTKIIYYPGKALGWGFGTKVYCGILEGRKEIAVKKIDKAFYKYFAKEVELLNLASGHPNVINYFLTAEDTENIFIALELCQLTLGKWVDQNFNQQPRSNYSEAAVKLLQQCAEGLNYIHSKKIVHRDIKPSNILLRMVGSNVIAKVTDFGLGKKIDTGRMSFTNSGNDTGTQGWKAPEVINPTHGEGMTAKVDVFALGCVFGYVLTGGKHPFGNLKDQTDVQHNIRNENYSVSDDNLPSDSKGTSQLIRMMISWKPKQRPPVSAILHHPMFWDNSKIVDFFLEVRSVFEIKNENHVSNAMKILEKNDETIFGKEIGKNGEKIQRDSWLSAIEGKFKVFLESSRWNYDGSRVKDLIRALRNKYVHYETLPSEVKEEIGDKNNYIQYWLKIFPQLLPFTWQAFEVGKMQPSLHQFYDQNYNFY